MDNAVIDKLAQLRGIGAAYHDYRGELRYFSTDTKREILRAMGCPVDDESALWHAIRQLEDSAQRAFLPPLIVVRGGQAETELNISARDFGTMLVWRVDFEDGSRREGATSTADCPETWRGEVSGSWITRRRFTLPVEITAGYHELSLRIGGAPPESSTLIGAPAQCYEPPAIIAGERLLGVAVQLYTLRSGQNWGIGDFADLQQFVRWAAACGCDFVGLNPLHALSPAEPERASPYSASSRYFLNVLYIAVPAIAEYAECESAQRRVQSPEFSARLEELRGRDLVDYHGVADAKFEVLALLYRDFRDRHIAADTDRGRSFRAFVSAGGESLQQHACFDALDRHLRATRHCAAGWFAWPEEYREITGEAVREFRAEHAAEIEFHTYLQWIAHLQLRSAQALTQELQMPIGLYGDYAVGSNSAGSETWVERGRYAMQAEIGAPPDPLALRGQGWGIPPQDPTAMLAERLQSFARLIRNNMRYYGALRLDHVMSLFRLWWVPPHRSPTDGAYVHYPLQQLLGVLALESVRGRCLVIGEDLGVVPDEIRQAMPEWGLYHYKVMLFEKLDGRYRRPKEYAPRAIATVTTHDMPTFRSWWDALDIGLRHQLNLYPNVEIEAEVGNERQQDRALLLDAVREQGLAPAHPAAAGEPYTEELAQSLHRYLARSTAQLVALQIEDLLAMIDPVNVPGTDREYPNWQRKISASIEELNGREALKQRLQEIKQERRS